jgi:hypothetical protein
MSKRNDKHRGRSPLKDFLKDSHLRDQLLSQRHLLPSTDDILRDMLDVGIDSASLVDEPEGDEEEDAMDVEEEFDPILQLVYAAEALESAESTLEQIKETHREELDSSEDSIIEHSSDEEEEEEEEEEEKRGQKRTRIEEAALSPIGKGKRPYKKPRR